MKWPFYIPQKMKIASVLAIIMGIVVTSNVLVRRNIDSIDRSFTSIYEDRLMAATEFFYITESLYQKRLTLEKSLWVNSGSRSELEAALTAQDKVIDSLIIEFQKTYLVLNEASLLEQFKASRQEYDAMEDRVIDLYFSSDARTAVNLFENEGVVSFSAMVKELHQLTEIQSKVGRELLNDSHHTVASAHMLSFLEVGIALVLGLLVHIVLLTSRAIQRKNNQNFFLN